jgi:hypothetical protein
MDLGKQQEGEPMANEVGKQTASDSDIIDFIPAR